MRVWLNANVPECECVSASVRQCECGVSASVCEGGGGRRREQGGGNREEGGGRREEGGGRRGGGGREEEGGRWGEGRWEVGRGGGGLSQIVNDIAWSHLRIGSFVAESNGYASVVKFLPLAA